ncbi:MAG: choice-of-anchor V domain-containing protein [Longimicrobiales bacterium]|nr:choice-of-anchor V domain-containing protein [Longimicrobiales bacterium]
MRWIPAAVGVAVTATAGWALPVYREGPPPAHTGGFGEPLCSECHFGTPVNSDAGSLTVRAPGTYSPGASYSLEIVLRHSDMAAAGFQLAARVADGDDAGGQAGSLAGAGPRTAVTFDTATGIQYAHQTVAGAALERAGAARWTVEWTAPDRGVPVVLHAAGNAANDDASEFGDAVFSTSVRIEPRR